MTPDQVIEKIGMALSEPLPRLLVSAAGGAMFRAGIGLCNYLRHRQHPRLIRTAEQEHQANWRIGLRSLAAAGCLALAIGVEYPIISLPAGAIEGWLLASLAGELLTGMQTNIPAADE